MRGRASRPSFDNGEPHTGAGVPRRTPTTSTTKQPKSTASAKQTKFPLSRPFGALRPSLEKCTSLHTSAGWTREEVAPPFGFTPGRPYDALLPASDRQKHLRSVVHGRNAPRPESLKPSSAIPQGPRATRGLRFPKLRKTPSTSGRKKGRYTRTGPKEEKRSTIQFAGNQPLTTSFAAFSPAICPKTKQSRTALPPTRFVPWMPPVISPAA